MEANFQNTPDLSSMLNGLLSNPSALSSLMSVLGGVMNGQQKPPPAQAEDTPAFSDNDGSAPVHSIPPPPNFQASNAPPFFSSPKAPTFAQESKEKTLLLAIKPFLSKNKCDTLDLFIKLLDIISLVGRIR